jgi:hypothetical protein
LQPQNKASVVAELNRRALARLLRELHEHTSQNQLFSTCLLVTYVIRAIHPTEPKTRRYVRSFLPPFTK